MTLLKQTEIKKVSEQFSGVFKVRNKGLFILHVSTGADISELLALTIGDVYQKGKPVNRLFFNNREEASRTVSINQDGIKTIQSLIDWHVGYYGNIDTQRPLFPSMRGRGKVALSPKSGHRVLKKAFTAAGLNYKQRIPPSQKSTGRSTHDPASYTFVVEIQGQSNSHAMLMYVRLNGESVKDFIIKRIKQSIPVVIVIKQVVIVISKAHEWWPILLEFISDLASVFEIILGIF